MANEVLAGLEDAVREPIVAHELPDVLDWVQFRTFRRQRHEGDVVRHGQLLRRVPPSLIKQDDRVRAWRHRDGDLGQVQVHCFDVAARQHKACAFALLGADRAEDVGRGGTLIPRRRRPGAAFGPAPGDLVLLADAGLIGEPHLYRGAFDALLARNLVQQGGEIVLKSSMAPSAWA